MSAPQNPSTTRRDFLKQTGRLAAASALAGVALPPVHAAESHTLRLALIGCGGRGSGAVANALESPFGPVELVAMADLFGDKLARAYENLTRQFGAKINVPADRQFVGFDAYRRAIDCLQPGDIAICATHAAFRPAHVEYAVHKGCHVFMEKTFAPDPGGVRRIRRAGELARQKNLKIAAGLMCRHSTARQAMIEKIRDGAMGQIQLIRAYRMDGGHGLGPFRGGESELLWQIRRPAHFLWASAGLFLELMIHQIDECCWLKDAWPVSAHGVGGRSPNSGDCGQNFDSYSVEYTFADGTKAWVTGRYISNCHNDFATFVHGTKCAGQFSGNIHAPTVQIYRDQRIAPDNLAWRPEKERVNPWQAEWDVLLNAIRTDRPHNEAERAADANLAAIMGRAAVHCGKIVTWEEMVASGFQFCPDVDTMNADSPAPVRADAQGRYPTPVPGAWTEL